MDSIVVAPMPSTNKNAGNNTTYAWKPSSASAVSATEICTKEDPDSRIPNIDELSAMLINKNVIDLTASAYFWSGSVFSPTKAWGVSTNVGYRYSGDKARSTYVRCVRR